MLLDQQIRLTDARSTIKSNSFSNFLRGENGNSAAERLLDPFPDIKVKPKFRLKETDTFFTIGSCFARNVERSLSKLGIRNITKDCIIPADLYKLEGGADRNGALNAYTVHSMLDLIRLPDRVDAKDAGIFDAGDGYYFDMMSANLKPLTKDQSKFVRSRFIDTYSRIKDADVVILTLGYTESWRDIVDDIYINNSPGADRRVMKTGDSRYGFINFSVPSILNAAQAIVDEINARTKGAAKVIITTSPVPLTRTWTDRDVITANAYSKCTLVSVANYLAYNNDNVDYYPSYEMVTMGSRDLTWKTDGVHVNQSVVDRVIDKFSNIYFS